MPEPPLHTSEVPTLVLTPATPLVPKRHYIPSLAPNDIPLYQAGNHDLLLPPLPSLARRTPKTRPQYLSLALIIFVTIILVMSAVTPTRIDSIFDAISLRLPDSPTRTILIRTTVPAPAQYASPSIFSTSMALSPEAWREYLNHLGGVPEYALDAWDL
jgi:hypothetical protein